jgi:hypothetical protein
LLVLCLAGESYEGLSKKCNPRHRPSDVDWRP